MTPEQRAAGVCVAVREHGLFNHVTDETWMRHIEAAIKSALDDALPDANDLDEVVHALGIEDSDTTPADAVRELMAQAKAWKEACRKAGVCMSCATGAPETFGCIDCLNTGWNGGSPEPKRVNNTPFGTKERDVVSDLLPCPFCGSAAERMDFETVGSALGGDPNAGGSCICCKQCGASSPVHFDRKENLYSSWNDRHLAGAAEQSKDTP